MPSTGEHESTGEDTQDKAADTEITTGKDVSEAPLQLGLRFEDSRLTTASTEFCMTAMKKLETQAYWTVQYQSAHYDHSRTVYTAFPSTLPT